MDKNSLESTNKLLKVIIALLLRRREADTLTLRQQIEILNDLIRNIRNRDSDLFFLLRKSLFFLFHNTLKTINSKSRLFAQISYVVIAT